MKTVSIHGEIAVNDDALFYDWWGIEYTCPSDVNSVIESLEDGEELTVTIGSDGGSVSGGQEIYSMLRRASAAGHKVICDVSSRAYSAASMIAMAGDVVRMSPVSQMMIHCASTYAAGNADDMEKTAKILRSVDRAIVQAYVLKTGMTEEELLNLMSETTWLTADECVKYHFADEIINDTQPRIMNVAFHSALTPEMIERARAEMKKEKEAKAAADAAAAEREAEIAAMLASLDKYGLH